MDYPSLRINSLNLQDIGGFREMKIKFDPKLNIICGQNGVGKTTVLDVIGALVVRSWNIPNIRRRAGSEIGSIGYSASAGMDLLEGRGSVRAFGPGESASAIQSSIPNANHLIYVRSNRDLYYRPLQGVLRDPVRQDHDFQQEASSGITVDNVKEWFSNRFLMSPHSGSWPPHRIQNLELAKTFFSLLDASVELDYVDSSSFDILLKTRSGQIPFEYMSAGFRTSYGLIFGILKEIEYRQLNVAAADFSGVILVDELDLHLHPTWHGPMLVALEKAYPGAQIIVTTHSPHMVQYGRPDNLIILPKSGSAPVALKDVDPEFGLIGWTVEEILRDVMGMEDARPPAFADMMSKYENAVSRQDSEATEYFKGLLLRALHPSSIIRQIIEIETIR